MNWGKAIELIENGDARVAFISTILLEHEGILYISFDGIEWEVTDSRMARRKMIE